MRIAILLAALTALGACETWEGIKKDVGKGVDAVDNAL